MLIAGNSREDGHLRLLMYMGKVTKYKKDAGTKACHGLDNTPVT
jgi:hypothetical protein